MRKNICPLYSFSFFCTINAQSVDEARKLKNDPSPVPAMAKSWVILKAGHIP